MTEAFRDFEHAGWADDAVCASYHDHFSSLTTQSIGALLDAAGVSAGRQVLDVATGAGYVAGAVLERGADVIGADFSAEQVRRARQQYPAASFRECDAGALPFEPGTFDAVVSNYGVLHFPDPDAFFREAFRVLRSGGRLAFTVWDVPREAKLFGAVLGAIERHGSLDVGLPDGPNMFLFSDPAACESAVTAAGFKGCAVTKVPQTWRPASGQEILDFVMTGTVRTRGALARQRPAARGVIGDAILTALAPFRAGAGYAVPMPAVLAAATRP
ncbi:MAG TPA: class I SAM-dependent methyltransferase [Burkholderiales bacterium]|nr:class I SAM-dependent methyltransferase [Burkholderiales bacterium]